MNTLILIIADIVSIITIALSFILKVPQIVRLIQNGREGKSVGLSLGSLMIELSSYTTTMMYNYTNGHAILTYLEYPILVFQEYIVIALVMHYGPHRLTNFLGILALYATLCTAFAYGILTNSILHLMLPLTVPAGAISKGMQLMRIVTSQSADSVSTVTWFLSVFTNVTRIFTVYVDSADFTLLLNFSISSFCSAAVLAAAIFFQRKARPSAHNKMD